MSSAHAAPLAPELDHCGPFKCLYLFHLSYPPVCISLQKATKGKQGSRDRVVSCSVQIRDLLTDLFLLRVKGPLLSSTQSWRGHSNVCKKMTWKQEIFCAGGTNSCWQGVQAFSRGNVQKGQSAFLSPLIWVTMNLVCLWLLELWIWLLGNTCLINLFCLEQKRASVVYWV